MNRVSPRPDGDVRLALVLAGALLVGSTISAIRRGDEVPPRARFPLYRVDLDAAPAGEIETLPGVGRVLAERIVAERSRGPFRDLDALGRVQGVGPTTIERLRPFARCGVR